MIVLFTLQNCEKQTWNVIVTFSGKSENFSCEYQIAFNSNIYGTLFDCLEKFRTETVLVSCQFLIKPKKRKKNAARKLLEFYSFDPIFCIILLSIWFQRISHYLSNRCPWKDIVLITETIYWIQLFLCEDAIKEEVGKARKS